MPIFGAVLGLVAGVFIGGFVGELISLISPAFSIIGLFVLIGTAVYGAWLGYRMLPI